MKIGDKVKYSGRDARLFGRVGTILEDDDRYVYVEFEGDKHWILKHTLNVVQTDAIIPDHYKQGNIDTIAFCESFFTKEQLRGAYRFNVIKYNHRYLDKNGLEDLKKAEFYLQKLIELENTNETD